MLEYIRKFSVIYSEDIISSKHFRLCIFRFLWDVSTTQFHFWLGRCLFCPHSCEKKTGRTNNHDLSFHIWPHKISPVFLVWPLPYFDTTPDINRIRQKTLIFFLPCFWHGYCVSPASLSNLESLQTYIISYLRFFSYLLLEENKRSGSLCQPTLRIYLHQLAGLLFLPPLLLLLCMHMFPLGPIMLSVRCNSVAAAAAIQLVAIAACMAATSGVGEESQAGKLLPLLPFWPPPSCVPLLLRVYHLIFLFPSSFSALSMALAGAWIQYSFSFID